MNQFGNDVGRTSHAAWWHEIARSRGGRPSRSPVRPRFGPRSALVRPRRVGSVVVDQTAIHEKRPRLRGLQCNDGWCVGATARRLPVSAAVAEKER